MRPRTPLPSAVRQILQQQDFAISRRQALDAGMPCGVISRLLSAGDWNQLARGVYQAHHQEPSWLTLAWAGVLIGGKDAVLGGFAAAHLADLTSQPPLPITILVPQERQASRDDRRWRFVRTRTSYRAQGAPPRCTVERAIIDICAVEPQRCVHWVTQAVGSRRTTPARLGHELDRHQRFPARNELKALLADVGEGAQSPLELLYLRDVERAHGLPRGQRQHLRGGYFRDVYYDEGLVVELDGRLGHEGAAAFRDMTRDNFHVVQGMSTLRFGWQHCMDNPCGVARTVAQVLASRGWSGTPTRCPRCAGSSLPAMSEVVVA